MQCPYQISNLRQTDHRNFMTYKPSFPWMEHSVALKVLPITAPIPELNLEMLSQAISGKGLLFADAAPLHNVG